MIMETSKNYNDIDFEVIKMLIKIYNKKIITTI